MNRNSRKKRGDRKHFSQRCHLRLTPDDLNLIERIRSYSSLGSRSAVVRMAIRLVHDSLFSSKDCRVVLRKPDEGRQRDIHFGAGPELSERNERVCLSSSTEIEVRLSGGESDMMNKLIEAQFGNNQTHVIRRSLSICDLVLKGVRDGWDYGWVSSAPGQFVHFPLKGVLESGIDISPDADSAPEKGSRKARDGKRSTTFNEEFGIASHHFMH